MVRRSDINQFRSQHFKRFGHGDRKFAIPAMDKNGGLASILSEIVEEFVFTTTAQPAPVFVLESRGNCIL